MTAFQSGCAFKALAIALQDLHSDAESLLPPPLGREAYIG